MSGNILADIISPDYRPQVCTVRPGIFRSPAPDASRKGEAVHVKVELEQSDIGTILKEILKGEKDEHPIETAKVVVAGGRGFHSKEEWDRLYELSELLGGSVGSRPPDLRTWLGA